MKAYSLEVLDELKNLEPIEPEVKEYIIKLLEYETSGGSHWKREYLEIVEKIANSNTDEI